MINYIRQHFHPLWRLRKLPLFRYIQRKYDPDVYCTIDDVRVAVKLLRDASIILPHQGHEPGSRQAFIDTIREHQIQTFLDIGANIGSYTWLALANGVEEAFLFEPDATNQRLLAKTIRKNSLTQCYLAPFAVSDSVGVAEFMVDQASGATGSLENHTENPSSLHHAYGMHDMITVPTLQLDVFTDYAKSKRVLIKIDVEGAEEKVFEGAHRFIEEVAPFIMVECFNRRHLNIFDALGYQIEELPENYNYLLTPPQ